MRSIPIALLFCGTAFAPTMAQDQPVARAATVHPYTAPVAEAARRFGIPEAWLWAVMRVESGGDPRAASPAGAIGLMQVMPATWAELRARYGLGSDPFDVRDNIMAGAAYLRELHDRYGDTTAMLAAYNAGPGRYDRFLSQGRPLPAETVRYAARLATIGDDDATVRRALPDPLAWRRAGLFVRNASASPTSVDVQPGDADRAVERPAERLEPGDARNAAATSTEPAETLFVSRASAGRPR